MELTEDQQTEFALVYGLLFSLSLVSDYLHGVQPVLEARKARNTYSKVLDAEMQIDALKRTVKYEFMKTLTTEQKDTFLKAIDLHSETVYRMFALDVDKQKLVWELIENLNREP